MNDQYRVMPDIPSKGLPQEVKHGTTTLALTFLDGVVMAADNRASAGYMVASPTAKKLHKLADKTVMSIAGGVADAQYVISLMRAEINIFEINRGREISTTIAGNLLATILYQQYRTFFPFFIGPILAGVDSEGSHIFPMDIAGSITEEPWASTGSGSPYAMGVMEAMWEPKFSQEKALEIALKALRSAIKRDIATGDGMDVLLITKRGIEEVSKSKIKKILADKYPFEA